MFTATVLQTKIFESVIIRRKNGMNTQTKLALYRMGLIAGYLVGCILCVMSYYILGIVCLIAVGLLDFMLRRCPYCGKHFSIIDRKIHCCKFCGKNLDK
jgi:hypothetical protein